MDPILEIVYGPPGTGKTHWAAKRAVEIIDGKNFIDDEDKWQRRHKQLADSQRIWWVTFHPGYAYEDFVEGVRPVITDGGARVWLPPRARDYANVVSTTRLGPGGEGETPSCTAVQVNIG